VFDLIYVVVTILASAKTHLQHILAATAINLTPLVSWLQGIPKTKTRISRFAPSSSVDITLNSPMDNYQTADTPYEFANNIIDCCALLSYLRCSIISSI